MQKFKTSTLFSEEENKVVIPNFSQIDLEFVKNYLYVDFEDDDMLIQLLLQSAKEMLNEELNEAELYETMPINSSIAHPLDKSELASALVLMIVSDLYNTRSTTATDVKIKFSPLFIEMKKTLRGKLGGYRL